jgi:alpha-methylacyl-CoA racemase
VTGSEIAAKRGALVGVRVLELAGIGPAPHAVMLLADLGASVLRIERPGRAQESSSDPVVLRGRESVVLDLKEPGGVAALLSLAEHADVLVEPYRPGVAERLGIGPEECLGRNPRLVYARMTGWGQDGPWASRAGHDINYIAITGALHLVGRAGQPPVPPANLLGDFGGGSLYLCLGVLAALLERARSGLGQVIDAAIIDGTASLLSGIFGMSAAGQWSDRRGVNLLDTGAPYYDVYETADGQWMSVGAIEPQFYAEFVSLLGIEDLPDREDQAHWPTLRERFTQRFAERTRAEWERTFANSDACVTPVLTLAEAAANDQLRARSTIIERDGILQPAAAPRLSRTPSQLAPPARCRGTDLRSALTGWGVLDDGSPIVSGPGTGHAERTPT